MGNYLVENTISKSVTVGTTAVNIAPEVTWGTRRVIVISNRSTAGQIITINWDDTAVSGVGIVLDPKATWSEAIDPSFTPNNKNVSAIADAAGGTLAVHIRNLDTSGV